MYPESLAAAELIAYTFSLPSADFFTIRRLAIEERTRHSGERRDEYGTFQAVNYFMIPWNDFTIEMFEGTMNSFFEAEGREIRVKLNITRLFGENTPTIEVIVLDTVQSENWRDSRYPQERY
jgi:hypothetical protein